MLKRVLVIAVAALIVVSCNKDKTILKSMRTYNTEMASQGYHLGDDIKLPEDVVKNTKNISISFGGEETNNLKIDPKYFLLGNNDITFNLTTNSGKALYQDATISVFATTPEEKLSFEIVREYPHNTGNFTQGFQILGNTIYESVGQYGQSRLLRYELGQIEPSKEISQDPKVFAEGSEVIGNHIYQLTWKNRVGFIYDKDSFEQIGQFNYPTEIKEGWGLTYDSTNLILSDGTSVLYFLNPEDPSQVVRKIGVAGNSEVYPELNELEYYNGYIYANVWQKPIILKIDPKTGAVAGKFDLSDIVKKNQESTDGVLNGIAFKGDHMLVTGKNWPKIYELKIN